MRFYPDSIPIRPALLAIGISTLPNVGFADELPVKGLLEVPHEQVRLTDGFWGQRLKTAGEVTVPHALDSLESDGHVTNFDLAAGRISGELHGHHAFDSDLYKALEGALCCLRNEVDPKLEKRVDGILDRILAAQQDDGFLISYFIVKDPDKRWDNLRLEHQMYNAGHFFEMAVEHHQLTGKNQVLNAAKRFADHIDGIFGPDKRYDVGGHEEIELALVKLYRETGERRYLELARFFLDERGHAHGTARLPFDPSTVPKELPSFDELPPELRDAARRRARNSVRNGRMQDHKPLVDQHEAIGHAVRAGYVYSAMADIVRFMDAPDYEKALDSIWQDVVFRKMYVTGSLGTAQYHDEGFGDPYLLPNNTYCESCANIAHVFWQHRMNLLKGQARYADVMELALYNGAISGISLSGDRFFYQNPLSSKGAQRSSWIGLSCCPTNLTRFIPEVGGFAYARKAENIYVNLFMAGEAAVTMDGGSTVKLRQETRYPWDGQVRLSVDPGKAEKLTLCLRVPGWALGHPVPGDLYRFENTEVQPVKLSVNGETVEASPGEDGYVHLSRQWKAGDVVKLDLPMPVQRVQAHPNVEADRGKVALMRGPLVYCLESVDHPGIDITRLALPHGAEMQAEFRGDLLSGVTVVHAPALAGDGKTATLTAIPYYAWCNRGKGPMTVWVDEDRAQTNRQ